MSSYYAACYGSGLKLNEKEFWMFVEQYMKVTGQSKMDLVAETWNCQKLDAWKMELDADDVDLEFDNLNQESNITYTWASDLLVQDQEKRRFSPIYVSPDNCDGMRFCQYVNEEGRTSEIWLNHEITYMFFSDYELDSMDAFGKSPYNSYEEFKQEFENKMAAYLPENFDWDAHIGRFSYARYA